MTQRIGTIITAPVVIGDTDIPQPSHFPNTGKGGYHAYDFLNNGTEQSVYGIRTHHRSWNMLAAAADKKATYKLVKGYFNTDIADNRNWKLWKDDDSNGGGGSSFEIWSLANRPYAKNKFVSQNSAIWLSTIDNNNFEPGEIDAVTLEPVTAWKESSVDSFAHEKNKDSAGLKADGSSYTFEQIYQDIEGKIAKTDINTDNTLGGVNASDQAIVSQKAIKAYVDVILSNALRTPSPFNAATATIFPTGKKGDSYKVTQAGTVQGVKLQPGDFFFTDLAVATANAADWHVIQSNVDQATTDVLGLLKIATATETIAETEGEKAVVPTGLAAWWGHVRTRSGLIFAQVVSFLGIELGSNTTPGSMRTIETKGSEANVDLKLKAKGAGKFKFESASLVPGSEKILSLNISSELVTDVEKIPLFVAAPPTLTSPGKKGQFSYDNNYFYVCIEDNEWVRYFLGNRDFADLIVAIPPTLTSPGIQGQIAFDVNYRYECYAPNMWYKFPHNRELVDLYVPAPTSLTSPGLQGQMAVDEDYLYFCITTNVWSKVTRVNARILLIGEGANGSIRTLEAAGTEADISLILKAKGLLGKIKLEAANITGGVEKILSLNASKEIVSELEKIPLYVPVPPTFTSPGKKGQQAYDTNYAYVCIENNQWVRYFLGNRDYANLVVAVPLTLSSPGIQGQIAFDVNYRYECYATNQWYKFPHNRELIELYVLVPATPTSAGKRGQRAYDSANNLMYECVAINMWVRYPVVNDW